MLKCSPEAFAKCPTRQYCGNSAADCDFTEGSDCDKFNQQIASQPVPSCAMCTNATTDPELTPDNDLSYETRKHKRNGYCHASCPEYTQQRAELDAQNAEQNLKKKIGCDISCQKRDGTDRAYRRKRS